MIKNEIEKYYYENGYFPRYVDMETSRYLIDKEYGSLSNAISKSLNFDSPNVVTKPLEGTDLLSNLENEFEYFTLTNLRFPTKEDCGKDGLHKYRMYYNFLGGFTTSTIFYDNLRAALGSRREMLGLDVPHRYVEEEYFVTEDFFKYNDEEWDFYLLLKARFNEIKKYMLDEIENGTLKVVYSDTEDWDYKLYKYQKYTKEEYIAVLGYYKEYISSCSTRYF